jgi:hypothetical protein
MPTFTPGGKWLKAIIPVSYNSCPWTFGVERTNASGYLNEMEEKRPHMG